MPVSAAFHLDAQASLLKKSIAASGTTTATLDDTTGVSSCAWAVVAAYNSDVADWSLSATTGNSTVVTAPSGSGKSCLLRATVNGGTAIDPVTGRQAVGDMVKQAKIYIAPETIVTGETTESDSTDGYGPLINAAIVGLSGGAGTPTFASVTVTDSDASFSISRSAANTIRLNGGAGDTVSLQANGSARISVATGAATSIAGGGNGVNTIDAGAIYSQSSAAQTLIAATTLQTNTGAGYPWYRNHDIDIENNNAFSVEYRRRYRGTFQSLNATPINLTTFATASNRVYRCRLDVQFSNDTDNEGGILGRRENAFKNVAGTVTEVGAGASTVGTDRLDASVGAASATIDFSGTDIRARFTGVAAKTINGTYVLTIYQVVLA